MDELLALFAEVDDEEDVAIQFRDATFSGSSLCLRLAISLLDSPTQEWNVLCRDVLSYELNGEGSHWLEWVDDHPLLWHFKHDSASAFFYRAPENAHAAIGALYEAHQSALGPWIKFGKYLNIQADLAKLLSAGNGLLIDGPAPLLDLYKKALLPHGVELDIRFSHPPRIWRGNEWRQLPVENDVKALILGTSYVIGAGWKSEKITSP